MAEYKAKFLKGLITQAKNVLLSDGTTDVESVIKWTYLGSASGTTAINVNKTSGTYKVIARIWDGSTTTIKIIEFPISQLSSDFFVNYDTGAYYTSGSNNGLAVGASLSQIKLVQFYINGVNHNEYVTLYVYHRNEAYSTS